MTLALTEAESKWLDSLCDGHGPSGTVDPHDIRELVRLAQRMAVVTDADQERRDRESDRYIAESLEKVAAHYRTPRHRRDGSGAKLGPTVRMLLREFINGWAS
jgi:hypothetical protein